MSKKRIKLDNLHKQEAKPVIFHCNIENDYEKKVRQEIYDTRENSDIEFLVGSSNPKKIKGHRFILMTGSKKFRSLLDANKGNQLIEIPDTDPEDFEVLLKAIYLHRFDLNSVRTAAKYRKLFEEYELTSAVNECIEYMHAKDNLNEETSISIYETTEPNPNNTEISQECLHIFRTNTRNILASESFYRAKIDTIVTIFEQPELCISSELDLLIALEIYAKIHEALPGHNLDGHHDRFMEMVRPALNLIRFRTMNVKDLLNCREAKNLLTHEELLSIVAHILIPENTVYKYPENFSNSNQVRAMLQSLELSRCSESSGINSGTQSGDQTVEKTIMWDVTDLARRILPTPNKEDIDPTQSVPLGNSTVESVKLVDDENEWEEGPSVSKQNAGINNVLGDTPLTSLDHKNLHKAKTIAHAPVKKFFAKNNSPNPNSFKAQGNFEENVNQEEDEELWD
uniref:CSON004666 protein n=1 Tax=Culicoides sonorensis TaxID=179676 RepID=A0A336KB74_CULSO